MPRNSRSQIDAASLQSRAMVGVLANSDGRAEKVQAALHLFLAEGVDLILHCGDIGGRHVLDALGASPIPCAFVWGDRDHDRTGLMRHGYGLGLTCFGMLGEVENAEKKLVVLHGDNPAIIKRLLKEQQYDYLLCGHELATADQTVGKMRLLNPGPLHGQSSSAMLLDPFASKVRIVAM